MRRASFAIFIAFAGARCSCSEEGPLGAPLITQIASLDQAIGGPEAAGRAGDWLLANERVRFVVQDAGSSTGWGLFGGSLVDLDRVHAADDPVRGDDRLQEIFLQCDLRAFEPTSARS